MADDFRRLFTTPLETWDQQFPRCSTAFAADLEAAELLADFNKLIRRARERRGPLRSEAEPLIVRKANS
jgi:ribosome-binding protein aMBF1 (putative translation factor)